MASRLLSLYTCCSFCQYTFASASSLAKLRTVFMAEIVSSAVVLALARAFCTSLESFCGERQRGLRRRRAARGTSPRPPWVLLGLGKGGTVTFSKAMGSKAEHWDVSHTSGQPGALCQEGNGFVVLSPRKDLGCRR